MTALTKEQIDALPKVARYDLDFDPDYVGGFMSEYKDGEYVLFSDFAATVIEQQAEIERLREALEKIADLSVAAASDMAVIALRKHRADRAATNALGNIAHSLRSQPE